MGFPADGDLATSASHQKGENPAQSSPLKRSSSASGLMQGQLSPQI